MFHEKLRLHVGAYLDHSISEYISNMSELEIHQTHYHICHLLLGLRESFWVRQLFNVDDIFKAWTCATGASGSNVQCLTVDCLIEEGQPKEAVELLEWLLYTEHSDDLYVQELLAKAYTASKQHQKAISLLKAIVKTREETERRRVLILCGHIMGSKVHMKTLGNLKKQQTP